MLAIGAVILTAAVFKGIFVIPSQPRVHQQYFLTQSPTIEWVYPKHLYIPSKDDRAPRLRLYKKIADYPELLRSGDSVFEGDEVQLQYTTEMAFAVILSVDGRGVVSQHFPDQGSTEARIKSGTHVLPFAFELDDAPGFEIFFMLASDAPIPLKQVLKSSRHIKSIAQSLPASENVQIDRVVLHKLPRPVQKIHPTE
ncbi:MAG: hypothetical protein JXX14_16890 [Deltaproteobacteria bacterium]|nr:hypothetical protein [Deltaproteobacteria bacterium]